ERTAGDLDQFISCCHKGAVLLSPLLLFSDKLKSLFLWEHSLFKTFFERIRKYNGAMAFASIVSNIQTPSGRGPYIYTRYQDKFIISLVRYSQIQIKFQPLDSILRQVSPFAQAFQMMREVYQNEHNTAIEQGRHPMEVQIVFDNDYENLPSHCLAVYPRSAQLKKIPVINADCDPISYPLLFLRGDKGWHPNMSNNKQDQTKRTNISMLQFYCYHIFNDEEQIDRDQEYRAAQCILTNNLVTNVFGNALENRDEAVLLSTVILCPTNKMSLEGEDPTEFPEEFLYSLTSNGLPPY
ncbi:36839_t:CDS:2, partial [Racocetra persica]